MFCCECVWAALVAAVVVNILTGQKFRRAKAHGMHARAVSYALDWSNCLDGFRVKVITRVDCGGSIEKM